MEIPFILPDTYSPEWVKGSRVPDVMYFRAEKLAAYKADTKGYRRLPLMAVPDLVVEVVSSTDNYTDVNKKVTRYLSDGVKIVWVVGPQTKTLSVRLLGSKQQTNLSVDDKLTGGDVIPGFEISVASIFD
jgi:Uma2 family endonuclease